LFAFFALFACFVRPSPIKDFPEKTSRGFPEDHSSNCCLGTVVFGLRRLDEMGGMAAVGFFFRYSSEVVQRAAYDWWLTAKPYSD